ncbi:MAG TPA: D-cysteine desulfhydrase family protein [Gemmatimonadaceae bacterium]|nr:D-cysteine desulfhydrase family protein [Gemmatimonadaceae bacterium]
MSASTMSRTAPSKFTLLHGPTPLHELPRLREALGGSTRAPRILIKRDDLAGPAPSGNKARKLEYVVADALAKGATHLITVGATQSNHARMTVSAARLAGLECVLVLSSSDAHPPIAGNLLLDKLMGADVHIVPPAPEGASENPHETACIAAVMEYLSTHGFTPYFIGLGASTPLGTLGYADAVGELGVQLSEMNATSTRLYYAAGSRGTQAGLVLGAKMHGARWTPHGIAVSPGDPEKTTRAVNLANAAAELVGSDVRIAEADVITHQEYYGDGYAIPTRAGIDAVHLLARTEAIFLDPVYTGKAMSGLLDHIRRGEIAPDETVIFLHTGGVPALYASAAQLGLERA